MRVIKKGRTAARPNSRAPGLSTYPRARVLGYLPRGRPRPSIGLWTSARVNARQGATRAEAPNGFARQSGDGPVRARVVLIGADGAFALHRPRLERPADTTMARIRHHLRIRRGTRAERSGTLPAQT